MLGPQDGLDDTIRNLYTQSLPLIVLEMLHHKIIVSVSVISLCFKNVLGLITQLLTLLL